MQPLQVLVVDDSRTMREMLKQQLEEFACDVQTAGSGEQAVAALSRSQVDVVITDLMMPGSIDGIKLLELAKYKNEDIAVIVLTGYASTESAMGALKKGAADYFTKPYNLEELLCSLRKIGRERDLRTTLRAAEAHRDRGFHDLKEIAENLHRKCLRAERVLRMRDESEAQRIEKALKILSA